MLHPAPRTTRRSRRSVRNPLTGASAGDDDDFADLQLGTVGIDRAVLSSIPMTRAVPWNSRKRNCSRSNPCKLLMPCRAPKSRVRRSANGKRVRRLTGAEEAESLPQSEPTPAEFEARIAEPESQRGSEAVLLPPPAVRVPTVPDIDLRLDEPLSSAAFCAGVAIPTPGAVKRVRSTASPIHPPATASRLAPAMRWWLFGTHRRKGL